MTPARRTTAVGLFEQPDQARDAILALRDAGFSGEDISVLMPDTASTPAEAQGEGIATSRTATGATIGGGLGALAGYLIGLGSLAIPGVGPFIAAGVLATSLGGLAIGTAGGAIAGFLSGEGMTEDEASWYENEVRGGRTLVTVRANGRYAEAAALLRRFGAFDVDRRSAGVVEAGAISQPGQIPSYQTDREQIAGQATGQVPPVPPGGLPPGGRGEGRI